ncbi:MAG: hypothetical protein KBC91_06990, partial [Candidatus Omnitrophica bacterium]|nr:hypothetical protein [Candidatus Omnitrophota bacterium]
HCVGRSRAEKRPRVLGAFFTLSLIVAGLTLAIFSVSSSAGSSLLKTSNNAVWYACAFLIAVNTILTLFHGSLQAQHRFPLFASAKIAEVSLLLLGGTWMLRSGWGPAGAVSGYALAMTCIIFYFVVRFKPAFVSWSEAKTLLQDEFQALRRLTFALGFLLILENIPAIWARYTLNETQSGYFGAVYNLRGAVWPFALAVTLTFYSHLLAGEKSKPLFRQALLLIAGLAIGFELGALLFSNWLVSLLYGNAFAPAAQYLALYGISLALQMAVMLLLFYRLGKDELRILPLLISLTIFFGALIWGDRSIAGIWQAQAAGAAACLVGLLVGKRSASSVKR